MKVLIDTSFIYAVFIEKSSNHKKAQHFLEKILKSGQNDVFFTTNHVVQESYAVFSIRIHDATYLNALDEFFYGKTCFFEVIYIGADQIKDQAIVKIIKEHLVKQPKIALSFVDASLVYSAKLMAADKILSFDSHFKNIIPYYK
jgi:predicted nucleic acid-binding protein